VSATPTATATVAPTTVTATPTATASTPSATATPTATPTPTATSTEPTPTPLPTSSPGLPDADAARAASRCQKAIKKAGAAFANGKLKLLQKCVDAVFDCVQLKPEKPECVTKAGDTCTRQFAKIAGAEDKLSAAILKRCAPPALTAPQLLEGDGLGYGNLDAECSAQFGIALTDVATIAQCVTLHHECRVEELLRFEAPRADEMLHRVNRSLQSGFCVTPTPSATPTPAATPTP
jgi:hypothetical protein